LGFAVSGLFAKEKHGALKGMSTKGGERKCGKMEKGVSWLLRVWRFLLEYFTGGRLERVEEKSDASLGTLPTLSESEKKPVEMESKPQPMLSTSEPKQKESEPSMPEISEPKAVTREILARVLVDEAKRWIGTTEKGGDNKGPEVEKFQKAVDGKASGEPWCMAFVQFCIGQIEQAYGKQSNVFKSEHCLTVWNKSPSALRRPKPEQGCLIVWAMGTTGAGHVGIVDEVVDEKWCWTIEGNTSDSSSVERNGDGVYRKLRNYRLDSAKMSVKGFLRVWE